MKTSNAEPHFGNSVAEQMLNYKRGSSATARHLWIQGRLPFLLNINKAPSSEKDLPSTSMSRTLGIMWPLFLHLSYASIDKLYTGKENLIVILLNANLLLYVLTCG